MAAWYTPKGVWDNTKDVGEFVWDNTLGYDGNTLQKKDELEAAKPFTDREDSTPDREHKLPYERYNAIASKYGLPLVPEPPTRTYRTQEKWVKDGLFGHKWEEQTQVIDGEEKYTAWANAEMGSAFDEKLNVLADLAGNDSLKNRNLIEFERSDDWTKVADTGLSNYMETVNSRVTDNTATTGGTATSSSPTTTDNATTSTQDIITSDIDAITNDYWSNYSTPDGDGIDWGSVSKIIDQQTQANRPDVSTPFGDVQWVTDPDTGKQVQKTTLSNETQDVFDQVFNTGGDDIKLPVTPDFSTLDTINPDDYRLDDIDSVFGDGGVKDAFQNLPTLDASNYVVPDAPVFDPNAPGYADSRKEIQDSQFNLLMSYLGPQYAKAENELDQKLANMGLPVGSEAFSNYYSDFNTAKNDDIRRGGWESVLMGADEEQRLWDNELGSYDAQLKELATQFGIDSDVYQNALRNFAAGVGVDQQAFQNMLTGNSFDYSTDVGAYNQDLNQLMTEYGVGVDAYNMGMGKDAQTFQQLMTLLSGMPNAPITPIDTYTPYQMQQNQYQFDTGLDAQWDMFNTGQNNDFWNNILGGGASVLASLFGG